MNPLLGPREVIQNPIRVQVASNSTPGRLRSSLVTALGLVTLHLVEAALQTWRMGRKLSLGPAT